MIPRICIVGAGTYCSQVIYPYVGLAGAEIAGACDLDRQKADTNARLYGGGAYHDFEMMLEAERPDGVIICVDARNNALLAQVAMRKSIRVFTENPPAPSALAALDLARTSLETGVLCTTGFRKRYSAAYVRAKEWIDSFPASDLYSISLDRAGGASSSDLCSSLLANLDLMAYLFGDVAKVYALSRGSDAYVISLKFANGAVGALSVSNARTDELPIEEMEISIRGSNGMTIHNSSSWRIIRGENCTEWREPPTSLAAHNGDDTGRLTQLVDFVEAVRQGRTTRSNIFESYKSMAVYEATVTSAETESAVEIHHELP